MFYGTTDAVLDVSIAAFTCPQCDADVAEGSYFLAIVRGDEVLGSTCDRDLCGAFAAEQADNQPKKA